MPVCQINKIRQISAKSQHNFHFLPQFNSKTTESIFTIFLHNEEQFVELLMHMSARHWCTSFQNTKMVNFDVRKNSPKLIGYHSNVPRTTAKPMSVFTVRCYAKCGICRRRVSVCLSHSGIVSKRLNVGSRK